ncbi:MAG: hypothetical protein ABI969_10115, partial [bacterium]
QRTFLARVLRGGQRAQPPVGLPLLVRVLMRIPILRDLPARFVAFGFYNVRVEDTRDVAR